jgi:hypothetical protein
MYIAATDANSFNTNQYFIRGRRGFVYFLVVKLHVFFQNKGLHV